MCTNHANHSPFALSSDGFRLASSSWSRCSGQATEVQIRPSIIVAPRRKEQLPVHFFLMCACVAVFKVGEFCGFPHFWSLRVQVNQVVVAFRNRLLCRILFSCGCIDKATNLFLYCNTSLLNGECGAVNCLIPKYIPYFPYITGIVGNTN